MEDLNIIGRERDHAGLEAVPGHPPLLWLVPRRSINIGDTAVGRILSKRTGVTAM